MLPTTLVLLAALFFGAQDPAGPTLRRPLQHPDLVPGGALHRDLQAGLAATSRALKSEDPAEARRHIDSAARRLEPVLRVVDDPEFLKIPEFLGMRALEIGALDGAVVLLGGAADAHARLVSPEHRVTLTLRSNHAAALHARGDRDASRAILEEIQPICQRTLAPDDPLALGTRMNLAATRKETGDLPGARRLFEELLDELLRVHPPDHEHVLSTRQNLASVVFGQGDLRTALAMQEELLAKWLEKLPAEHPNVLFSRLDLAETLETLGELAGAHAQLQQTLEVLERTLPEEHPRFLAARARLGITLRLMGDLEASRAVLEDCLAVAERTRPDDHTMLLGLRGNLATTRMEMGDVAGALVLHEAVLAAVEERNGPHDGSVLLARQIHATCLYLHGEEEEAAARLEDVLEKCEDVLGPDHPYTISARANLAVVLESRGRLERALELQEAALEAIQRTRPADRLGILAARHNRATALKSLGELERARGIEEENLREYEALLPADHVEVLQARQNLAVTLVTEAARRRHLGEDVDPAATRVVDLARSIRRGWVAEARSGALSASAREAEERSARMSRVLGFLVSLVPGSVSIGRHPEVLADAFLVSESTRGVALLVADAARRAAASAEYARLRGDLRRAGVELAIVGRSGGTEESYHRARERREEAERRLLAAGRELGGASAAALEIDVADLAVRLGKGRAAVAVRRVSLSDVTFDAPETAGAPLRPRWSTQERLVAFVLAGGEAGRERGPALVDLGPADEIESCVRAWRTAISASADRGLARSDADADPVRAAGLALRRKVVDPLLARAPDAERLVFVPDDVLNLVPIDALPLDESGVLVGDRVRVETRLTLWELARGAESRSGPSALVALGGAAFNSQPADADEEDVEALGEADPSASGSTRSSGPEFLRGGAWERGFAPLSHAAPEAREIAELHSEVFGVDAPALVLERRQASRPALESAAPRARWLHVATHGWFVPESVPSWDEASAPGRGPARSTRTSGEVVRGMSPMLLCGLALAGANLPADEDGRVAGIVTAEELSTLDLSGCRLAVLSACDTNVGERRAGQGIASLQKALHMAGAESTITSMWRVPDEATRLLMLDFYRRLWVEKKPKAQALWEAKRFVRNLKHDDGAPRYAERDWAAWVLTGEPD